LSMKYFWRSIFIGSILLLTGCQSSPSRQQADATGWKLFSETPQHQFFIERNSVQVILVGERRILDFWSMINYIRPRLYRAHYVRSMLIHSKMDCNNGRYRLVNIATFEGPMATGKVLTGTASPTLYRTIQRDTLMSSIHTTFCTSVLQKGTVS